MSGRIALTIPSAPDGESADRGMRLRRQRARARARRARRQRVRSAPQPRRHAVGRRADRGRSRGAALAGGAARGDRRRRVRGIAGRTRRCVLSHCVRGRAAQPDRGARGAGPTAAPHDLRVEHRGVRSEPRRVGRRDLGHSARALLRAPFARGGVGAARERTAGPGAAPRRDLRTAPHAPDRRGAAGPRRDREGRSALHQPQPPRRLRRRARSPDRRGRSRRLLSRRRQRARGRGGRAALARGRARRVAAARRGRGPAPRAAQRQQALPQRAPGRVGLCVPLPDLPRRIHCRARGGALVPRPPRFAPITEAMPGAVFSPVAGRLREMPGGLCPLHVGDTWMEPFTGGRMQDLSEADHPGLHRYCETRGVPALIDALVEKVRAKNGLRCERENVLVTAGATGALGAALGAITSPGDEVLILAPFWPLIRGIVSAFRADPVEVPFYDRVASASEAVAAVAACATPRTTALYVSSPSNPTGRVLPEAWLAALAEWAEREGIWLISDEVYEDFVYRGA